MEHTTYTNSYVAYALKLNSSCPHRWSQVLNVLWIIVKIYILKKLKVINIEIYVYIYIYIYIQI